MPTRKINTLCALSRLVQLAIDFEAAHHFAYYVAWLQSKGQDVAGEAAGCGYFAAELNVRLAETALDIMGLSGTIKGDNKWAPLYGKFQDISQRVVGFTISGGSTEIRKNVVASQKLGLPRD